MRQALFRTLQSAAVFILTVGVAFEASAQPVPPAQTGSAFPGRVEDQIQTPDMAPQVMPKVEVRKLSIKEPPEGAENITFHLTDIIVDGVTAYTDGELNSLYQDRIGKTITLADLYTIAAELTRQYRNDGYILTQVVVPPQTIEDGRPHLKVVEGFIDNVTIQGEDDQSALELIRTYAAQIKAASQTAMNIDDLERALLLINDLPGITARSVLSPSKDMTGAADILIIVERKSFDATIGIDNYGTRFLGPIQLSAAGSLNSLLGYNETISAQLVVAPSFHFEREMEYFSVAYKQPFGKYGTTFDIFGSDTNTEPGFSLDQFNVRGQSKYLAATINHPFIRTRTMNLSGRAKFDYRNVNSRNDVEATRKDRIRAVRVGGRFDYLDTILGVAYNVLDMEISQGLDLFGASNNNNINRSRARADRDFLKLNAEAQRLQRVTQDVNLLLGVTGQVTNDPLYSSEEFGLGGGNYGRGFDSSEIIGDEGVAGKLEVQWNEPYETPFLDSYQLYGFYDAGRIWNKDATTSSQKTDTLTSTGFGVRAEFNELTSAGLLVAIPLNRDVQTQGDRDPRLFFNLNRRF